MSEPKVWKIWKEYDECTVEGPETGGNTHRAVELEPIADLIEELRDGLPLPGLTGIPEYYMELWKRTEAILKHLGRHP